MKTSRTILPLLTAFASAAVVAACGGDDTAGPSVQPDAGSKLDSGGALDSGSPADSGNPIDSGTPVDSGKPDGGVSTAKVRVAHLSPDAPAVDFCLAPHGTTTFIGPVLKGAGAAGGLSFGQVTKYIDVPAIQYDVRIVAPNAASCATSLANLPDVTNLPALGAGIAVTLAAEGELAQGTTSPFGIKPYVDATAVAAGKAKLRFVHASPGTPAVDVGVGGGVLFTGIYTNVAFGAIGSGAPLDAQGYLETAPIVGAEVSARANGTMVDVLAIKPTDLPAGAIATAFAFGKIGDANKPLKVLLCVDNAPPNGLLSACTAVGAAPERAKIRVAHLSPDAPAVDVCIKPHAAADYSGASLLLKSLGATAGLSYPQVTTWVDLPIGAYDIRVVVANAASCATGAVPDTNNVTVTNGLRATVAATGDLTVAGSDPAFALKIFIDESTVASGKAKLRFVHASPGTPAVDVGVGTGASFTKIYDNVAFGLIGSGGGLTANGYLETTPLTGVSVTARVHNQSADALVVPNVSLPATAIATAFAIGGKTGQATNPLKVLLCVDSAAPIGLLTSCSVAP